MLDWVMRSETLRKSPTAHHQISRNLPKTSEEQELTAFVEFYTNSGDYDGVFLFCLLKAITKTIDYCKSYLPKAIQLYNAGDYLRQAYFQSAVKMIKSKPYITISFWLAQTYYELNQFEDAVDGFFVFEKMYPKRQCLMNWVPLSLGIYLF